MNTTQQRKGPPMATSLTPEREKRTAFPTNIPARSPYSTQGNPVREFGDVATKMVSPIPAPTVARAADGRLAGPGVTPYAPYRMAIGPRPGQAAPVARPARPARPAGAAMATPTPIPAVGTMPPEQEVQGTNVNPVSSSLAAAFPAARQAYSDANAATLDAASKGNYSAALGQAARGAVVAPVMGAFDVGAGVARDLASIAKPVAQFGYTAVTGDASPIWQGDPRSTSADTPASKNPASDQRPGAAVAMTSNGSGSGRGSAADPRRTDVDPTDPRFGAARDVSRQLASVPKDLPADLREGVVFKTKDANGRTVYSGRNVGENAQMVDGMGRQVQGGGGTVSTVPGMAKEAIAQILARPLDPRTAMTAAQRFQYDKEVQNAQGVNNFNAGVNRGRGTSISDILQSGNVRRALANQNAQGEIASRQQQDQSRSAADVLAQRRQNESEANSTVTRRTGEVEAQGAEQIQALRTQVLEAETPEERNSAAKKLAAITGKEQQNRYTVIPGGSEMKYDDKGNPMGVVSRPSMVLDNSTGRLVDLGSQQGGQPEQSPYPDATRLTGKDGKVYMVKNGRPVLEAE